MEKRIVRPITGIGEIIPGVKMKKHYRENSHAPEAIQCINAFFRFHKRGLKIILSFIICFSFCEGKAQEPVINPILLNGHWSAHWISCPDVPQRTYGVYHFRKNFQLEAMPAKFIIHVSADNRYRLFINGKAVCSGPARSDLAHWNFETIDIAGYLHGGGNTIAALVWNMAEYAAVAQISNQTGFLLQGDSSAEEAVNSNESWKVYKDSAYTACSLDNGSRLRTYMVIGPGDEVNGQHYPWGWEQPIYDDAGWVHAVNVAQPEPAGYGTDNLWTLVPRTIPLMQESMQRIIKFRRSNRMQNALFIKGDHPLQIAANDSVSILLDQTYNTVAFPELIVSGGSGAKLKITYAEALSDSNFQKGNRDSINGKEIKGNYDVFLPDGGSRRLFSPLWFRTFRYLQLDIVTGNKPLIIEDLYGTTTGYPFKEAASFSCDDASMKDLWDVAWRTARLCAGENYFDCPYYEQLQYEGDTRIQALISLYITGDDRLMRKAITDFYNSRIPEGLTQGRYPSNRLQVIPPFSLFWVSMIYDYWMHRRDDAFISRNLLGITAVLDWYEKNIDPGKQMLGPMKWWNFADWDKQFDFGVPDGANDGNSSVITLQYAYTLRQAGALFSYFKKNAEAAHYDSIAQTLSSSTYKWCFDQSRGEMANTPDKKSFSQHAGIMALISGSIPEASVQQVMKRILTDTSLSQATFYYRFYLTRALKKAGLASLYYSQLQPWRNMLKEGLTTFAENPDPTRSDCHAWSASPMYDFLSTICGIVPASPGFGSVLIAPALGQLNSIKCEMPHPEGHIKLSLQRNGISGISGEISLPPHTGGTFLWNGKKLVLVSGTQKVSMN